MDETQEIISYWKKRGLVIDGNMMELAQKIADYWKKRDVTTVLDAISCDDLCPAINKLSMVP